MSLGLRRLIFIVFLLAFLIVTPLIILYAAGYKISKTGFQKTGIFILDSKPKGAKIFINGKVQKNFLKKLLLDQNNFITTPAKIKNLSPGEYTVSLELDGFWGWQKKLIIYPGASTYAEDIYLFKKDLPMILTQGEVMASALSPNKENLAILTKNNLILINLTNDEQKLVASTTSSKNEIVWSNDNKKIMIDKVIYDVDNLIKKLNLNDFLSKEAKNFKWFNDKLYYQEKNSLNYFDLSTDTAKKIINDQKFNDYLIKGDNLYVLSDLNQSVDLNTFIINSGELIGSINLPSSKSYYFINPEHQLLNIYDQNHQILYLVEPQATFFPLKEIINNIKQTYWIDNNKLLFANDFEIWLYNSDSNEKILITRISDKIDRIIWHPSNNYIIYSTKQTINSIELDERGSRNFTQLIKLDEISSPVINSQGNVLYFYGKIGSQKGLYKLALQ